MANAFPLSPYSDTEYACLNSDLSAVDYWMAVKSAEKAVEEAIKDKELILHSAVSKSDQMCRDLLDMFAKRFAAQSAHNRKERVEQLAADYARILKMPLAAQDRSKLEKLATEMLLLFASLDVAKFRSEWTNLFGSDTGPEHLARLDGKIGGMKTRLRKVESGVAACFAQGRLPNQWRGTKCPPEDNKEARQAFAHMIISNFCLDWQRRAGMFEVPVTISGIAISTLPEEAKRIWSQAYKTLGLRKSLGVPCFSPTVSEEGMLEVMRKRAEAKQEEKRLEVVS